MRKSICIPVEQYYQMLDAYDKVVAELEAMKKALKEAAVVPVPADQNGGM